MLHPAARKLVAQGTEKQVLIGCGHDEAVAPALVLLHGFTHTGASWDPVRRELGERYRAYAPDIRGHGAASESQPVELEDVVSDVLSLLDGPFALAGYSMGGRIAMHVALEDPDRVERLIVIGASPGLADPEERAARQRADDALADEIEGMMIEAFAKRWAQTPVLAGQAAEARALLGTDRLRNTPAGLARALRGLGTGALPPLWERLGELSMPVSLVAGEHDAKFIAIAREMSTQIPQGAVTIFPGAGHAVHVEAAGRVARLIDGR
jgi:2-succinyl-6-hydroxy-2,4-cyclohexadiene-1-carboxylate synthase